MRIEHYGRPDLGSHCLVFQPAHSLSTESLKGGRVVDSSGHRGAQRAFESESEEVTAMIYVEIQKIGVVKGLYARVLRVMDLLHRSYEDLLMVGEKCLPFECLL